MINFLFLFIRWPLRFPKKMNPSFWYNPKLVLGSIFPRSTEYKVLQVRISQHHQSCPVTSKQLSVDFFLQVSFPKSSKDFLQCMIKLRSLSSMVGYSFTNWNVFYQNIFIDEWVEFLDIKLNKWAIIFIESMNKLFQNWIGILPLVEMKLWNQFCFNFLNDWFVNFSKFVFRWIN